MKIILTQDVPRVGYQGDLMEVKDGYARNYLLPQGFAVIATRGNLRQYEHLRKSRADRESRLRDEARETVLRLGATPLQIAVRAGDTGQLYGSVTSADIARALEQAHGIIVDRRKIELKSPIRVLGDHRVRVAPYPDIATEVHITVVSTLAPEPAEEALPGYDPHHPEAEEPAAAGIDSKQAFEGQSEAAEDRDASERNEAA